MEADPFLQCVPSKISAGAIALANYTMGRPIWTVSLQNKIGYALEDVKDIVMELNKLHKSTATMLQQALKDKYKSTK
jgi:cyclin-A